MASHQHQSPHLTIQYNVQQQDVFALVDLSPLVLLVPLFVSFSHPCELTTRTKPSHGAFFAREYVFTQSQLCWQRINPVLHGINANYGKNGGKLIAFFLFVLDKTWCQLRLIGQCLRNNLRTC